MGRSGTFIIGVLVLALAAAGILVWADVVKLPESMFPQPPSVPAVSSTDTGLISAMNDAVASGGFAATLSESDARRWLVAEGHRLERFSLDPQGPAFARLTSAAVLDKASNQWPTLGLSVGLPLAFTKITIGQRIEVGIVARSAPSNGSPNLTAVYATQQAGNSGWKSIPLQSEFQLLKFVYDVPAVDGGYANSPIIVLHSDATGGGRAVEIIGVYAKAVQ